MTSRSRVVDALYRVKRGLAGYVSYLAACEMNESFSEYLLYEPTLRVLSAVGFSVKCEVACPGLERPGRGDKKRLDFVASAHGVQFALEMKWARNSRVGLKKDLQKLRSFKSTHPGGRAFLMVFGRKSHIEKLVLLDDGLREQGSPVYAEFGITRFGCRNYEVLGSG